MIDLIYSKFFFLFTGLAAFVLYVSMTRFLNWSIGVSWSRDIWPGIKDDPQAVAKYFGLVRLTTALLIAAGMLAGAAV
jgi:hypothetical protein